MLKIRFAFLVLLSVTPALAAPAKPVFSVKIMEGIARSVSGMSGPRGENRRALIEATEQRLHEAYPELIAPPSEGEWVFNSVGGSLAELKILFCSMHEYVALWGSPVETEGFSGRYAKMDVWDIMLDGRMFSYAPGGTHQVDLYSNDGSPGSHLTSWLKRGVGKHFRLEEGAYMIDYGRGSLLSSLGSGAVLGHRNVTGDRRSLRRILGGCAKQTFRTWFSAERRQAMRSYRASNPDFQP